jgi:iron-sulfur cluster repair protein YtfE (RIC family)
MKENAHPEDHGLVRNELRSLEEAVALVQKGESNEECRLEMLEALRGYFLHELLNHLNEEEAVFFPAVEALPAGAEKVAHLYREHETLRNAIEEFRAGLVLAEHAGPEARPALDWRLITDARSILTQLRSHAAFEYELVQELNLAAKKEVAHVP